MQRAAALVCGLALAAPLSAEEPRVFQFASRAFEEIRQHAEEKSFAGAIRSRLKQADEALQAELATLVQKKPFSPAGADHRDYVSFAPYFWPNPKTQSGLPFVRKDGERNPIYKKFDVQPLEHMGLNANDLAWAFYLKSDERYAERSAQQLRVWFLDEKTAMRPHLKYAQFVPGLNSGRKDGIVETNRLLHVVDAVGLMKASKTWTADDQRDMEKWFQAYRQWLLSSPEGMAEGNAPNNHGSWYAVQTATFSLFINDRAAAKQVIAGMRDRIDRQIAGDGSQPLELKRTKSFDYSVFNLDALFAAATLGDQVGVDLWNYRSRNNTGIRAALDYLVPYAAGEKAWPHQQISPAKFKDLASLLRRASIAYQTPTYDTLEAKLAPKGLNSLDELRYPRLVKK